MIIGVDISRIAVRARTGTEQYTWELLAALAQLDQQNPYRLYTGVVPEALPPLGPNMAVRRIRLPRLWTHVRLSAELLAHPPDVLFIPAHVVPLAAPLARRTRTVVTIHDLGYLRFPEAHTRTQRLYLRLSTVWSARMAAHTIAISGATRDDLVRLARIAPERITVVHHGCSPRFAPAPPEAVAALRHRMAVPPAYLLYVGTIQPRKNLVRLLDAFAAARLPADLHLVLAGKRGWLAEPIERRAHELGIAERVRFAGYVPDADLPALLSGATAFTFPSLYEGFGMPVIEAMACGAPVLTSSTTALPEVARDAALLVNPQHTAAISSALERLVGDEHLRATLRERGFQRAAMFTWERCARATLQVLQGYSDEQKA